MLHISAFKYPPLTSIVIAWTLILLKHGKPIMLFICEFNLYLTQFSP